MIKKIENFLVMFWHLGAYSYVWKVLWHVFVQPFSFMMTWQNSILKEFTLKLNLCLLYVGSYRKIVIELNLPQDQNEDI